MARFFIDIDLDGTLVADVEGMDLPNLAEAEQQCVSGLLEVAQSRLGKDVAERITTTVMNDARQVLLRHTLSLTCHVQRDDT